MTNHEISQFIDKTIRDGETKLSLARKGLTALPPEVMHFSNGTKLYLHKNQLTHLPEEIGSLSRLQQLYLHNNQLTQLPEAIGNLSNLETLDLENNQLTSLPETMGQLTRLTNLYLGNNHLTSLPEAIAKLTDLTTLSLFNNKLTSLPTNIRNLSKLEKLDLRGNPELAIPPELLGSSWDEPGDLAAILNYYFQRQTQGKKPLNEAKVLLVGEPSVGKTSLCRKLLNPKARFDQNEAQTDGITIQTLTIEVSQQPIKLNLWDFGGQEIMQATHQFFLSQRSLYLLVINCRQNEFRNQVEYWLKIIKSFGGDSPIILVGNQCDHKALDIDQTGLQQKYPNLHAICETSCQNNQGIDSLNKTMIEELKKLPHLHDPLPQTWFTAKEQLEQNPKDFLSRTEYEEICVQACITDSESQTELLELLHQLGIVLNFANDIRFNDAIYDTNVLKPEWITNAVYSILSYGKKSRDFNGVLDLSDLPKILNIDRYPAPRYSFIIDMMRKFELCFDLYGYPNERFLIPGLLPQKEPYTGDWEGSFTFKYQYNVLPPSIISRFIVRMNSKIIRDTYWRNGVVLEEEGNTALIKNDREDKHITIQIKGNSSTYREFLSAIRSNFDEIHKTIPELEVSKYYQILRRDKLIWLNHQDLKTASKNGRKKWYIPELDEDANLQELLDQVENPNRQMKDREQTSVKVPEVFISYAWKSEESVDVINKIESYFKAQGITLVRDIRKLKAGDSAKAFMDWMGKGKCIITVISDEYLKSRNCMYELVQINENSRTNDDFEDRVFPILLPSAKISEVSARLDYMDYWDKKNEDLADKLKNMKNPANLTQCYAELDLFYKIRATIDPFIKTFCDTISLDPSTITGDDSSLQEFFEVVSHKLNE
jgi:internalin A